MRNRFFYNPGLSSLFTRGWHDMSYLPFKICPNCGIEHVHTALICSDCNVELEVWKSPVPGPDLPPARDLCRLVRGRPWELKRLASVLQQSGIPSQIDTFPPDRRIDGAGIEKSQGWGYHAQHDMGIWIYVLESDHERANRIVHEYRVSNSSGGLGTTDFGEPLMKCPACGTAISDDATECVDCGLEFPNEPATMKST